MNAAVIPTTLFFRQLIARGVCVRGGWPRPNRTAISQNPVTVKRNQIIYIEISNLSKPVIVRYTKTDLDKVLGFSASQDGYPDCLGGQWLIHTLGRDVSWLANR